MEAWRQTGRGHAHIQQPALYRFHQQVRIQRGFLAQQFVPLPGEDERILGLRQRIEQRFNHAQEPALLPFHHPQGRPAGDIDELRGATFRALRAQPGFRLGPRRRQEGECPATAADRRQKEPRVRTSQYEINTCWRFFK